jgi:predicted anti-sigma-YlaC factor YlaD
VACEPFRDALSARLDGEDPGMAPARLEEHLAGCAACRAWHEAAAEVTRRARLVPAPQVPDVTAAVLAALPAARPVRRPVTDVVLRLALLVVGAGQLAVALPALTRGAEAAMAASPHLTHETAAWNLGLAVCFLAVAARPRLAAGSLPFLLSFTAVLAWVTVGDLSAGHVHAERAGVHVLLAVGVVLVSLLAGRSRSASAGPGTRLRRGTSSWPASLRARLAPGSAGGHPPLRALGPVARRSAAAPLAADRAA